MAVGWDEYMLKETTSVCPTCLTSCAAQIIERDGKIWMLKRCATHGAFETQLESHPSRYYVTTGNREDRASGSCCVMSSVREVLDASRQFTCGTSLPHFPTAAMKPRSA